MEESKYIPIAKYEPKSADEVNRVVLLYSGGLDTSVMVKWIQDKYRAEVIALCIDIGQQVDDLEEIRQKALKLGAIKSIVVDAKDEFANNYIAKGIRANAHYQGDYFLSTPLGRPLLAKLAVETAIREKADTIAHGCTGKGNDQVRIDGTVITLNPSMKVIAPVREWGMGREEEIEYARKHNIPIPNTVDKPYSADDNMWGVTCEGGEIEDPELVPPMDKFLQVCANPNAAPNKEEIIDLEFEKGLPTSLNGIQMKLSELIIYLNKLAGRHGVGIVHHLEDRVVGLKVRGVYEQPAAAVIIKAHRNLEKYVCTRIENKFKETVDQEWAYNCYAGLWYEPLMDDLNAFIDSVNKKVTGTIKLRLYKGSVEAVAIQSPYALFDAKMATFNRDETFNQNASPGFIELHTLQMKMAKMTAKNVLVSIGGEVNKRRLLEVIRQLDKCGCQLHATTKTNDFLMENDVNSKLVHKISQEKEPNIDTMMMQKYYDLVINIPSPEDNVNGDKTDGDRIRKLAIYKKIPLITDIGNAEQMVGKMASLLVCNID
ncbi:argininosuccinate synthase [Patescibacteria group bacterium]|nr:argininosuccinate synthase [Patescibacteria group bacterium]